jgi:DNA polymerase I-like protein with 3'-5' exonuclease and polymerase domains
MHTGSTFSPDPRELVVSEPNAVRLPSGRRLYYPELRFTTDDEGRKQFLYGSGNTISKVYSGLMDENLVQAIARDVIAYHALQVQKHTGYRPALKVHDELVYVAPEDRAHELLDQVNAIMRSTPPWLPGIILYSEGGVSPSYGEAK